MSKRIGIVALVCVTLGVAAIVLLDVPGMLNRENFKRRRAQRNEELRQRTDYMVSVLAQARSGLKHGESLSEDDCVAAFAACSNPYDQHYVISKVGPVIYVMEAPRSPELAVCLVDSGGGSKIVLPHTEAVGRIMENGRLVKPYSGASHSKTPPGAR